MNTIPISSLNHYAYCPRRAWYVLVTGEQMENAHLLEGKILHKRADSAEQSVPRRKVVQRRTVRLYSRKYGLSGIADLVEETHREIYPVDYKKGEAGDWRNDQLQLCAQALCLEEMLGLNKPIRRGFVYYAATGRRKEIRFTQQLRDHTIQTIEAVKTLVCTGRRPEATYSDKCEGCSVYPICLPKEVEQIKDRKSRSRSKPKKGDM